MRLLILHLLLLFSFHVLANNLFHIFQNPPPEAKPFVRWWWNGNCLSEREILRELDIMKEAGIGGIEINPIAMPNDATRTDTKCFEWGSPEWSKMVQVAIEGAKKRGLITDMIIGTGWPFGGQFLEPEEQIQGIVVNTFKLRGPIMFSANLIDSVKIIRRGQTYSPDINNNPPAPELKFIYLAPIHIDNLSQMENISASTQNGWKVKFNVPAGEHLLFVGTLHRGTGFRMVTNGAPGANGPCLDHYNEAAVLKYLDRLALSLNPILGEKLGNGIRALFVDSIELSGSNWTNDLLQQFEEKYRYDMEPYLPFVIYQDAYRGYLDNFSLGDRFADEIKRVRFDYNNFLVDLFLEKFTKTYHEWCHSHHTKSRYQAYGMPWLVGIAEGYMIPDIPESNNWLFSPDAYTHGYNVWNKYTSSGGHLCGRPIISCESMTNTRGVFSTTLDIIKAADDLNFIMGLNHSVLHGFNYSPPEAGFPGWVRYGTYFNEQNPWWPYFKLWSTYNARLSAVFQASQPVVDIAILNPKADIWSSSGLHRSAFQLEPWYCHRLWEAISNLGASADYVSEKVLIEADYRDGKIRYGPMKYKTLILADVKSMNPETATALLQFAKSGGKIIFIGTKPFRSASLANKTENDKIVEQAIGKLRHDFPKTVFFIPAPAEKINLMKWTENLFKETDIPRTINITHPDPAVFQICQRLDDQDIFFFVNSNPNNSYQMKVTFDFENKSPWKWDPETGKRTALPFLQEERSLAIHLNPHESMLLVFEPELTKQKPKLENPVKKIEQKITSQWKINFQPIFGNPFSRESNTLFDLSTAEDTKISQFAGTIIYRTEVEVTNTASGYLDLGEVFGISEAKLNGNHLGVRWYGKHVYELKAPLLKGKNSIEIKISTVLLNYVKSLTNNKTAQVWTKNQQRTSSGLIGPVTLILNK